jgi:hypothetical protein
MRKLGWLWYRLGGGGFFLCATAVPAFAELAVAFSTDAQVGPGGAGSTFTPTYVVSNSDLINGRLPSASTGNFAAVELAGGLPVLTDGVYGTITEPGGAADRTHRAFALGGGGDGTGTSVTYALDTAASPLGYNISSVAVYGGWNDRGRDQQLYSIAFSKAATPGTFVEIGGLNFNSADSLVPENVQTANRSIATAEFVEFLATGAGAVRFTFGPGTENGYSGYAEIDVFGTPVPEPGVSMTAAIAAAGAVLTARRRC